MIWKKKTQYKPMRPKQLQVELSCYSRQETVFLSTQLNIKMATGNMLIPLGVSWYWKALFQVLPGLYFKGCSCCLQYVMLDSAKGVVFSKETMQ